MRGRRQRTKVQNDVSSIQDDVPNVVPPKKRRVHFAEPIARHCVVSGSRSIVDSVLSVSPPRHHLSRRVQTQVRLFPKPAVRKTRSDKGLPKSSSNRSSIHSCKKSWKMSKRMQASHARSFIKYEINGKIAAKTRQSRHALETRQLQKLDRLRTSSVSPLARQSPITTTFVSRRRTEKRKAAKRLQLGDVSNPCNNRTTDAGKEDAARILGLSIDQIDQFDNWVQENRKVPNKPRLLREQMILHLHATFGIQVNKKRLSKALHALKFDFVDPKSDYFQNRRALDSTQQHMERVIVFLEFLEYNKENFSVACQDETSPSTNIKDLRLWTKADAPPSKRYCPDFKPGKGPALSISAAVDIKSGEFVRLNGKVVGTIKYASSDDKGKNGKKRNMETGANFARLIGNLCSALKVAHKATVPVIFCDSPNIHRSAFSADSSIKQSVSKMNLIKGDDSLKGILLDLGLWQDGMTLQEARNVYRTSEHYRQRRMGFFTDVEVHAFIQGGILLFNANSCPDFNIIEQYWRHGHALYEQLGNQAKKALLDSWTEFLEKHDNRPFLAKRKRRVEQMRRYALMNPGSPKLTEYDVKRKKSKDGKRKWIELDAPIEAITTLQQKLVGSRKLNSKDAYHRIFAYAHYLNTVRMNGPAKGHNGILLSEMPEFDFDKMWKEWEPNLRKQVEKVTAFLQEEADNVVRPETEHPSIKQATEQSKTATTSGKTGKEAKKSGAEAKKSGTEAKTSHKNETGTTTRVQSSTVKQKVAAKERIPEDFVQYDEGGHGRINYAKDLQNDLVQMKLFGNFISDLPLWEMLDLLKPYIPQSLSVMPLMRFQQVTFTILTSTPSDVKTNQLMEYVKRDASKISGKHQILFPAFINSNHFVLYVVDPKNATITLYNSMVECAVHPDVCEQFVKYLQKLIPQKKWIQCQGACSRQIDGSNDCAIYMISFIRSLIVSNGSTVESTHGPQTKWSKTSSIALRKRFADEIKTGELLVWE